MTTLAQQFGAPAEQSGWHDLDPIDRSWSGIGYVRAFLDLDMPSADRFRRAVRDLALESAAFGRFSTATPPQWRAVADAEREAWLDRVVHAVDEVDVDPERAFAVNAEPLIDLPFRFVVGPNWISARMTHAVADGYTVNAIVGHLLDRAASDEPVPVPWLIVPARRRDRMIVTDALKNLGALFYAVRHRNELAGGTYEPIGVRAAALSDLSIALVSGSDFPATLRALRDELYPDASAAAVAMVGLRAAFAATLPEPRSGFECLFNTRSTDAGTATCWGNWSVGVYIRPSDDYSPSATAREMARVRDLGLPQIAAASLRARARRSNGDSVQVVAPEGAPRLTLSYTQQFATAKTIPGLRSGRSMVATETRPNGIETVTVQAVELADRLSVSVSFYPDAWSREAVENAVHLFLDDPRALLIGRQPSTNLPT